MKLLVRQTAIGRIGIAEERGRIARLCFDGCTLPDGAETGTTPLLEEAFRQLEAYLAGRLTEFTLPLAPAGSEFMQSVWNVMLTVPYGKTASYREIAAAAGSPKAVRAVGMACNRNPLPIFIPCHRIVGADGRLTGYRGGLTLKERLLALEKNGSLPDAG